MARGFNSRQIGELLAIFTATKIIGPSFWAFFADKTGKQLVGIAGVQHTGDGLVFRFIFRCRLLAYRNQSLRYLACSGQACCRNWKC